MNPTEQDKQRVLRRFDKMPEDATEEQMARAAAEETLKPYELGFELSYGGRIAVDAQRAYLRDLQGWYHGCGRERPTMGTAWVEGVLAELDRARRVLVQPRDGQAESERANDEKRDYFEQGRQHGAREAIRRLAAQLEGVQATSRDVEIAEACRNSKDRAEREGIVAAYRAEVYAGAGAVASNSNGLLLSRCTQAEADRDAWQKRAIESERVLNELGRLYGADGDADRFEDGVHPALEMAKRLSERVSWLESYRRELEAQLATHQAEVNQLAQRVVELEGRCRELEARAITPADAEAVANRLRRRGGSASNEDVHVAMLSVFSAGVPGFDWKLREKADLQTRIAQLEAQLSECQAAREQLAHGQVKAAPVRVHLNTSGEITSESAKAIGEVVAAAVEKLDAPIAGESTKINRWDFMHSVPMLLNCPSCNARHVDKGIWATKPHHTHACQECGHCWRPAVTLTTGVQFLPGFKDEVSHG